MSQCSTGHQMPHRAYPCNECPFRTDATLGRFPAHRYEALAETVADPSRGSAPMGAPMFGCHKGAPGTNEDLACAGWLAVEGAGHVGVRLAVALGHLPASALSPGEGWPELYDSYQAMAAANAAGEEN